MPQAFVLTAQINVAGPVGLGRVADAIKRQLGSVHVYIPIELSKSAVDVVKKLNTQVNQVRSSLEAAAATAQKVSKSVSSIGTKAQEAMRKAESGASRASSSMASMGRNIRVGATEMTEFGRAAGLAFRRFMAFSIPAGALLGMVTSIKRGISSAIEFERQMLKVRQVTGLTASGIGVINDEISRLSKNLGVSSEELAKVSLIFAQSGMSINEVRKSLKAMAEVSLAPTFQDMASSAEGAIAVMHQFNLTANDMKSVMGAINAIAGSFAVESGDLIEGIRRAGGAFKIAGASVNDLLAAITAVRSTTREMAAPIATGLRTIITRMRRPRTIEFLERLGITIQDAQGKFIGVVPAIRALNKALSQLDPRDVRYAQIVEQIAGFRQITRVVPLIQQLAVLEQALAVAEAGVTSTTKDTAIAQENLAIKIEKVRQVWAELYRDIEKSSMFKQMSDMLLKMSIGFSSLARSIGPIVPILAMLSAVKVANIGKQFVSGFAMGVTGFAKATTQNTVAVHRNTAAIHSLISTITGAKAASAATTAIVTPARQGVRQKPIGFGTFNIMAITSMIALMSSSISGMNSKINDTIMSFTKLILAIEVVRFAINSLSSLRLFGGLISGFGRIQNMNRLSPLIPKQTSLRAPVQHGGWVQYGRGGGYIWSNRVFRNDLAKEYAPARRRILRQYFKGRDWLGPTIGQRVMSYAAPVAGVVAAGGAVGGVMYGSKLISEAMKDAANSAKYTSEELDKLTNKYTKGKIFQYAGYGAGMGAAIGTMIPGAGNVVGAVGGALAGAAIGALVAALSDNTEEIRKLNRESRFTVSMETLSKKMEELLSGRSLITGSDLGSVGAQLSEMKKTIIESYISGDVVQAKQREAVLAKQLANLVRLSTSLSKRSSTVEEFKSAGGGAGRIIIETIARIKDIPYEKQEQAIKDEIQQRIKLNNMLQSQLAGYRAFDSSVRVLKLFNAAIHESSESLKSLYGAIDFLGSITTGAAGNLRFYGGVGSPDFANILSGRVFDQGVYENALSQAFMGVPKIVQQQIMPEITSLINLMSNLPKILRESAPAAPLGEEYLVSTLGERLKQYQTGGAATRFVDAITSAISRELQSREGGGPGVVLSKMRNTPQEFAKELLGKEAANYINELGEIVKHVQKAINAYLTSVDKQVAAQNKITDSQLAMYKSMLEYKKTIFELENPMQQYTYAQAQKDFIDSQQVLTGLPSYDIDVNKIGERLSEVNKQLFELSRKLQNVNSQSVLEQTVNKMSVLRDESHRLTVALQQFKDVTTRTKSIMAQINELEERRKTKFSLIERYVVGGIDEKQQILATIKSVIALTTGQAKLSDFAPDMRKNIAQMFKEFWNIPTAAFGGKKGYELWPSVVFGSQDINNKVPKFVQQMFGFQTVSAAAQQYAQPVKRSKQEDVLIKELRKVYDSSIMADKWLIDQLSIYHDRLTRSLALTVQDIGKSVTDAILKSRAVEVRSGMKETSTEIGALTEEIKRRKGALEEISAVVGIPDSMLTSPAFEKTVSQMLAGLDDQKDKIEEINKVLGMTSKDIFGSKYMDRWQSKVMSSDKAIMTRRMRGIFDKEIAGKIIGYVDKSEMKSIKDEFMKTFSGSLFVDKEGRVIKPYESMNDAINRAISGVIMSRVYKRAYEQREGIKQGIIPEGKLGEQLYNRIFNVLFNNIEKAGEILKSLPQDRLISNINDEIKKLTNRLKSLNDELKVINDAASAVGATGAVGIATGGPIFKPRGSDTVPAMLTPGEFVVNREATKKNRRLLERINRGDVVYARGGTYVDPYRRRFSGSLSGGVYTNKRGGTVGYGPRMWLEHGEEKKEEEKYTQTKQVKTWVEMQAEKHGMTVAEYKTSLKNRRQQQRAMKPVLPQNIKYTQTKTTKNKPVEQNIIPDPPDTEYFLNHYTYQQLLKNISDAQSYWAKNNYGSVKTLYDAFGMKAGTIVNKQWMNEYLQNMEVAKAIMEGLQGKSSQQYETQASAAAKSPYAQEMERRKAQYKQEMASRRAKYQKGRENWREWRKSEREKRKQHSRYYQSRSYYKDKTVARLEEELAKKQSLLGSLKDTPRNQARKQHLSENIAKLQERISGIKAGRSSSSITTGTQPKAVGGKTLYDRRSEAVKKLSEWKKAIPPDTNSDRYQKVMSQIQMYERIVAKLTEQINNDELRQLGGIHVPGPKEESYYVAGMASRGTTGRGYLTGNYQRVGYASTYKFSDEEKRQILGENYPDFEKQRNTALENVRKLRQERLSIQQKIVDGATGQELRKLLDEEARLTEQLNSQYGKYVASGAEYVSPAMASATTQRMAREKMIQEGRMTGEVEKMPTFERIRKTGEKVGTLTELERVAQGLVKIHKWGGMLRDVKKIGTITYGDGQVKELSGEMLINFATNFSRALRTNNFGNVGKDVYYEIYNKLMNANLDAYVNSAVQWVKNKQYAQGIPYPMLTLHSGGFVPGQGDVPAMLQGGEYVVNKKDAQYLAAGGAVVPVGTQSSKMTIAGIDVLNSSVDRLSSAFNGFNDIVDKFGGFVNKIKDALSQEITINVKHSPIEVTVDGDVAVDNDDQTIASIAWKAISPEIDRLRERMRDVGPGLS